MLLHFFGLYAYILLIYKVKEATVSVAQALSTKERSLLSRLRQIINQPHPALLRASWVKMNHPCGKSYCRCAKTKTHWHLSWYLSQSFQGKPRMKSVPKDQLPHVRLRVKNYQQAKDLLATLGTLPWEQIGKGARR